MLPSLLEAPTNLLQLENETFAIGDFSLGRVLKSFLVFMSQMVMALEKIFSVAKYLSSGEISAFKALRDVSENLMTLFSVMTPFSVATSTR